MSEDIRRYPRGSFHFPVPDDGARYLVCYVDRTCAGWWNVDDALMNLAGSEPLEIPQSHHRWYAVRYERLGELRTLTERHQGRVKIHHPK